MWKFSQWHSSTVHFDDDGLKFNKDSARWFSNVKRLNDVVVRQDDSTKGQVSVQVKEL